jgi:hypothetical protein
MVSKNHSHLRAVYQRKRVGMLCPPCTGTGRAWGYQQKLCGLCNGDAILPDKRMGEPRCAPCEGSGRKWGYMEELCDKCGGWGLLPPPERAGWSSVSVATSVLVALGVVTLGVASVGYLLGRAGLWEIWLVIGGVLTVPASVVQLIGWATGKLTVAALAKRREPQSPAL